MFYRHMISSACLWDSIGRSIIWNSDTSHVLRPCTQSYSWRWPHHGIPGTLFAQSRVPRRVSEYLAWWFPRRATQEVLWRTWQKAHDPPCEAGNRINSHFICSISSMTYRPIKILILMLLQEGCPDKYICHLSLFRHIFSKSFARTNSTQAAALFRDCLRCSDRGWAVADSVEDILQVGVRSGLDTRHHLGIAVVESVTSTKWLDKVMVAGTAGRHNVEAVVLGNLDGVKSDACCNAWAPILLIRHISLVQLTASAPDENSLSRLMRDVETVLRKESKQCCARGERYCGGLLRRDAFRQREANSLICDGVLAIATQSFDLTCSKGLDFN